MFFAGPMFANGPAGNHVGFQYSRVEYTEPDIEIAGFLPGIKGDFSLYESSSFWLGLEGRLAGGELDYDGQTLGTNPKPVTTNTDNFLANGEVIVHVPEGYSKTDISPYYGVGYRLWENDIKDSNNVTGFLREVEYLYLPAGLSVPWGSGHGWSSEVNFTYRYLVEGTVTSHLSDANSDFPDVENTQDDGDGVSLDYTYRRRTRYGSDYNLSVFLNVWDIGRSDLVATNSDIDNDGSDDSVFEPENKTLEVGGRLSVNF